MTPTDDHEALDALRQWAAEHQGCSTTTWRNQSAWNSKTELRLEKLESRMTAIEKKIAWVAGASAAAGSLVGQLLHLYA